MPWGLCPANMLIWPCSVCMLWQFLSILACMALACHSAHNYITPCYSMTWLTFPVGHLWCAQCISHGMSFLNWLFLACMSLLRISQPVYLEESFSWYEGYTSYRAIFYRGFIWKELSLLTKSKLILHDVLLTRFKYSNLISPSSFEFLYCYLCWVKFNVNNINLSLKT